MKHAEAAGLLATIERLVSVGDRSCGGSGSAAAATELERAFRRLGLPVHEETFRFLRATVASSGLIHDGDALDHLPLAYAGAGSVAAPLVDGGAGEEDLVGRAEVRGALVLVRRDPIRHRQAQYQACVAAGASGMILVCDAPGNRPQAGSVREAWEGPGPIPCLAVGSATGARLLEGKGTAELFVDMVYTEATGRNLIATVEGPGAFRAIEVGAHYDAWGPGAVDNASGCAALVAVAEHLIRTGPPSPVQLVAFDGEEIGLLGAWHRVRRRFRNGGPGPGALIDLEMPSSAEAMIRALAITSAPGCGEAAERSGLSACYDVAGPMASAPELLGGYIPADVWPYYMAGLGALCTVCDTPHYHTDGDLPETVDARALAAVAEATAAAARILSGAVPANLGGRDVPRGSLTHVRRGEVVELEASFRWEDGRPADGAPVELLAFRNDFVLVGRTVAAPLGEGRFRGRIELPKGVRGPIELTAHRTASGESAEVHARLESE